MSSTEKNIQALKDIIISLRSQDGCPWDKKQTPQSFKSYLIEEAHELLEAIDNNNPAAIKEELGDMLFQLLFINQLYEEQHLFNLSDVAESIIKKMIRRHPHVFGDETVDSDDAQRQKWNEIKAKEKKLPKSITDLLSNVPKSLPGLRRAQRVSERAAHNGFEWQNISEAVAKLEEEVKELKQAVNNNNQDEITEELGDALFVLVNIGRLTQINAEDALHNSTNKFINRFSYLEKKVARTKNKIADTSHNDLLALWSEVKNELTEKH